MKMNEDRDWLFTKANEEDHCIISVGGLACRVVAEEKETELSETTSRKYVSETERLRDEILRKRSTRT
jgi:hypothetical protein